MKTSRIFTLIIAVVISASAVGDAFSQTKRPVLRRNVVKKTTPVPTLFTVAAGKKIRVRMNDTINSTTARVGDTFTVTTVDPVYSTGGVVVIPQGSEIVGRITVVTRAAKGGRPGSMDATFNRVRLPNGYTKIVNGSLTELSSDGATSDNEGGMRAGTMKHRKVVFIGGGAAGGAVLGGLLGGPKGTLIGAGIGAVAGILGERNLKGKEAEVSAGTEFGIYLNQSVSLPRYKEVE
jgi:hypothetical protein